MGADLGAKGHKAPRCKHKYVKERKKGAKRVQKNAKDRLHIRIANAQVLKLQQLARFYDDFRHSLPLTSHVTNIINCDNVCVCVCARNYKTHGKGGRALQKALFM